MNWNDIRKDFPMLKKGIIYFDNAATTFKPQPVIDACVDYLSNCTANAYRGDYDLSAIVDKKCEEARHKTARFINAEDKEVIFTSGASGAINTLAYSLGQCNLMPGDEIVLTEAEHAANLLPWFNVCEKTGAVIKYLPLTESGKIEATNLRQVISTRTKIVSIAHISNVLGYVTDVKSISKVVREYPDCVLIVDAAQSAPHVKIDVKDMDVDFLFFSGHKMLASTGIGILYGKYDLLKKMNPLLFGGGMNYKYDMCGNILYLDPPRKFEAGTPNIEGVISLGAAVEYLDKIGIDNICKRVDELYEYLYSKMKQLPNVTIYNPGASSIVAFNIKGIFAQDAATFLNSKKICVRAGQHCAKILMDFLKTSTTLRASLYFYNTKEEIDSFIEAIKQAENYLDVYI